VHLHIIEVYGFFFTLLKKLSVYWVHCTLLTYLLGLEYHV